MAKKQKSPYEGQYVRRDDDPTFWFVKDGKRHPVESPVEMYVLGLHIVTVLQPGELDAIHLWTEPEAEA